MPEKKPITFTAPQLAAAVPLLLALGGGVGWFTPKDTPADDPRISALMQEYKNKEMLDSIGRVASSVCALNSKVAALSVDLRTLMDTVNSMNRRTPPEAQAKLPSARTYDRTIYSMRNPR